MGFRQMRRWRVGFFVKVSDKVELVFALGASRTGSVGICCCLVE